MTFQTNGFQNGAFQIGGLSAGESVAPREAVICPNVRRQEQGSLTVGLSLLLTTLAVATLPVGKSSMEMPQGRAAIQHDVGTTSLALFNPPVVASPFVPLDWQNPQGARQPEGGHVTPSLALYNVPAPDTSTLWRTGVFSRPLARQVAQTFEAQNLLGLNTVVPAGEPFRQSDWPNPVIRARLGGLEIQRALPAQLYYIFPYAPSDSQWPNPVGRKGLNGGFESSGLALSTPVVAGSPFIPPMWEAARVTPWAQVEQAQRSIALDVVPPPPGTPFVPPDFQNPIGRKQGQGLEQQNSLPLSVPPAPPDTSTIWRTGVYQPRILPPQPFQWTAQNLLPLNTTATVPYYPSDNQWPNPVRALGRQQPQLGQNTLLLGYPDPVIPPVVVPPPTGGGGWLFESFRLNERRLIGIRAALREEEEERIREEARREIARLAEQSKPNELDDLAKQVEASALAFRAYYLGILEAEIARLMALERERAALEQAAIQRQQAELEAQRLAVGEAVAQIEAVNAALEADEEEIWLLMSGL